MSGTRSGLSALAGVELAVVRALAEAADADETYNRVLAEIGTALGWAFGAVWEVSSGRRLRCLSVWQATETEMPEFRSLTERTTLSRGEGLPGRVWASGEPAWITDVAADANFPRAAMAARSGVRAALCFPIGSRDEVVGAIEFFTCRLEEPDESMLASMTVLGALVGQFVVRRRAEGVIRKREALTGAILGAALDSVITMDEAGRILEFNPAAERMFGYTRDEAIGKEMAELVVPPSLRDAHRRGLARYLETGRSSYLDRRVELTAMRSDGSEFPVELAMTRIDLPGPRTFTGFIRDITEQKRAEVDLRDSRARLVETAASERRRLERNLHDGAQQNLNALALKLRLATSSIAQGPETTKALLREAQDDLSIAIAELRELARGIHPAALSQQGLGRALVTLADRCPVDVTLCRVPTERLGETVEVAVYYVVAEALTNVAKHADARSASVSVMHEGGTMVVEVTDDGCGGADVTTGSGLRGLADRVEALGGRFVVDSARGGGTQLRAEIPTT